MSLQIHFTKCALRNNLHQAAKDFKNKDGSKCKLGFNYRLPKKIEFVSCTKNFNHKQTSYGYFKKATVRSKVEWQQDVDCCSKKLSSKHFFINEVHSILR